MSWSPLQRLFHELKRRKVFRVAGVYALVAWGVIEVAETTAPLMALPEWVAKLVLFLAILGFPIALVLAWALEVTPEGVKRTKSTAPGRDRSGMTGVAVVAILLTLVGFGAYSYLDGPEGTGTHGPITSVAVLPFANLSSDPEQEYFSDGITEELLDALAQLDGLRVPARTSSFAFKGRDIDIREIARTLGVEAVLEGSVRKAGDRVRITAQLIEAEGGYHLWSEVYERRLTDIFAVQDEITQAIVAALEVQLEGDEAGAALVTEATSSPEAYNEYLLGRYHWNRRNEADIITAIQHFERALALDPRLASAHAGLAGAYSTLGYYNYLPADEAFGRGRSAAQRALELDASSAEAYAALGYVRTEYDWDWDGAEEAFRRAIELNPGHPDSYRWFALTLAAQGKLDESVEMATAAAELDPVSPIVHRGLGRHHYFRGEYDAARERQRRALQIAPGFFPALYLMAQIELAEGRFDRAMDWIRQAEDAAPGHPIPRGLAVYALARSGQRDEAERQYRELRNSRDQPGTAFWLAIGAVGLDRSDEAFQWLQAAYRERSAFMAALAVEPLLEPLQGDPRFRLLLEQVGL